MEEQADIWADDLLGREEDAKFLQEFLIGVTQTRKAAGRTASFVLNVDAEWGDGKTFFMHRFAQQLEGAGYLIVQINAWSSDYADEPLLPVMSAIDELFEKCGPANSKAMDALKRARASFVPIMFAALRGGGKAFLKRFLADGAEEIADMLNYGGEEELASDEGATAKVVGHSAGGAIADRIDSLAKEQIANFNKADRSIVNFKKGIGDAVAEFAESGDVSPPLFVLIDELDRCRPTYAIALLERVKHLFDIENVIFVIATDTSQLQHSIKAVYGAEFNSQKYLHRFFDQSYLLSRPKMVGLAKYRIRNAGWDEERFFLAEQSIHGAVTKIFDAFNVNARDALFVLDILENVYASFTPSGVKINIYYLTFLAIAFREKIDVLGGQIVIKQFINEKCIRDVNMGFLNNEKDAGKFNRTVHRFLIDTTSQSFADNLNAMRPIPTANEYAKISFHDEFELRKSESTRGKWTKDYPKIIVSCGRFISTLTS